MHRPNLTLVRIPEVKGTCAICLSDLSTNFLYRTPCDNGHEFHATCLVQHFQHGRVECPLCRVRPATWVEDMKQFCTAFFIRADDTTARRCSIRAQADESSAPRLLIGISFVLECKHYLVPGFFVRARVREARIAFGSSVKYEPSRRHSLMHGD